MMYRVWFQEYNCYGQQRFRWLKAKSDQEAVELATKLRTQTGVYDVDRIERIDRKKQIKMIPKTVVRLVKRVIREKTTIVYKS